MRVIELDGMSAREVDAFGSSGFSVARLALSRHVVVAQLAEGGVIGRHDAVVDQLFVVLSGGVRACGADGQDRELTVGQAALWSAGESHETNATVPTAALIMEAVGLSAAMP